MAKKRIKTPALLQMEAVECGAASLGIILSYLGKYVPLEQLRYDCDVNRDGSNANNILQGARGYGLKAKGYKKEVDALTEMKFPLILHWNFNHFVVLEGIDIAKGKAYLNDPAEGHRTITIQELQDAFTGVVLSFETTENFKKDGKRPSVIRTLRQRLVGYEKDLSFIILVSLLMVIPGLIVPVFLQVFVDNVLVEELHDWFVPLIIGMALTGVFKAILDWMKYKYLLRLETKFSLSTSSQFFWHVLRLPIDFFNQRYAGDISHRVSLNDNVAHLLSSQLAKNFLDLLLVVFYFLVMLQYDLLLSFIGLFFALLNIVVLRWINDKRVEAYSNLQQADGKLSGLTMSGLQMIETIKSTGSEDDFFKKWAGYMTKVINVEQKVALYGIILNMVPTFLSSITTLAILTIGSFRIMDGYMTIGMLVAFQSLMANFSEPVDELVGLGGKIQEAKSDINRLDDILKAKLDKQTSQNALVDKDGNLDIKVITQKLEGFIEFKNVTFGYSRYDEPLIKDFNLKIAPGERVALVGGSGSGKSTVAKLLSGLYEPWSGEILLDGIRREDLPREVINNSLAMVDQNTFLFEASTKELITLWDSTIPDAFVIRAAKDAEIHDIIGRRKDGYESPIDEGGRNLSGGQRQRIEIARALVINPSILILDEATSALDPITELNIEKNIRKRSCSVLSIAHRLSTIRDSDEIIVLRYGEIIERGTHESLRAQDGAYAALIKM